MREKNDIVDVIGERVNLKKAGRIFKGLCPFHSEKTPSFNVDPVKQLYHCFGCGAGGDVYSFVMAAEGYDFGEAVEALARRCGHALTPQASRQAGRKTRLLKACEEATVFYEKVLRSPKGKAAAAYIEKRGLKGLIEEYRLGYSPDWSSLIKYLAGRGVSEKDMLEAGLAARSAKGTVYDRLRCRLIFPITDNQGRPVGFGGRVLDDSLPKYLNSPETPLYHKGEILYGLNLAKNAFLKTDTAIVVEGYTDLLALAGAGVRNVVATLGTAFTSDHLKLLGRFAKRVVLVFDGDEAGLKAAERSSEYLNEQKLPGHEALMGLVEKNDVGLAVAVIPEGLDPADFISSRSVSEFSELLSNARPLGIFLLDRIIERHGQDAEGRTKAAAEAGRLLATLGSPVAKEEYSRYLADRLGLSYEALIDEVRRLGKPKKGPGAPVADRARAPSIEREMIMLLLHFPERAAVLKDVELDTWRDGGLRELGRFLLDWRAGEGEKINEVIHKLKPELQKMATELLIEYKESVDIEKYFTQIYMRCKESALDRRIVKLKNELKKTDSSHKKYDQLFEELVSLEYKRRELKKPITDGGSLWIRN